MIKFLIDENIEKPIIDYLKENDFDVKLVSDISRALTDDKVIKLTNNENRILVTNDKDFGELVYRQRKISKGILLIRANSEDALIKVHLISEVISKVKDKLLGHFIVVNETGIRDKDKKD